MNRSLVGTRRALVAAVALGVGLTGTPPAGADDLPVDDALVCHVEWSELLYGLRVEGDSFSGKSLSDCHRERIRTAQTRTAIWVAVDGTWSSTSCGSGVLRGRMTIPMTLGGPVTVDFEVPTVAGAGSTTTATASDGDGKTGSGVIALHETVTARDCAPLGVLSIEGLVTVTFD